MELCESKVGGICAQPATWKQAVQAGQRGTGRVVAQASWCDQHAEAIVQRRRRDWQPAPDMTPLVAETP